MTAGVAVSQRSGAIASPHHLATEAGEQAFLAGGNAIDAAIVAAAVLTVVYPNNTALGGDLVALVRTPDGRTHCVNATGHAPAAQSLARLRELYGTELPFRGVDTVTVPGGVRGWETLRSFGARLSWSDGLAAAVRFAADGTPVSRSVAMAIAEKQADLLRDPGCRQVFLPAGRPLSEGELLVQPALAQSLSELQTDGPDAIYGGSVGRRLVDGLNRLGAVITLDDLKVFEPEISQPLSEPYRGYDVLTSPPNTQGLFLLRALRQLQRGGHADGVLDQNAGALAAILKQGNAVRDLLLADPRFTDVDVDGLLEGGSAPAEPPLGPTRPGGDTVGISTIDSDGYAVSLIQSVYNGFGAAVLEPGTGILLHNRGRSFSLDPQSPNVVAPGKRPRHTLMPVIVASENRVAWVSSTMGGHGQPQIHAQLLLRSLAGASPAAATSAPRWIVGVQEAGDTNETVYLESDVPTETVESLLAAGFVAKVVPPHDEWLGHSNLIKVGADGRFEAASDPRSDGSASVVALPALE